MAIQTLDSGSEYSTNYGLQGGHTGPIIIAAPVALATCPSSGHLGLSLAAASGGRRSSLLVGEGRHLQNPLKRVLINSSKYQDYILAFHESINKVAPLLSQKIPG